MKRDNSYLKGNQFANGASPNRCSFKSGHVPWNKGKKGLRLSPATEFKKGQRGIKWVAVGTVRVRRDKGKGQPRVYVKVAEPSLWKLRAILTWERKHGAIPQNYVLHHQDHDSLNDDLANLVILTRGEHLKAHEQTLRTAAKASPKRMGWGPGGKRVHWRRYWMQLELHPHA